MGSRPIVYLRTDGNENIATGHLMRCLSIARALRRRNARPVFVVSDMTSITLLQRMMSKEEIAGRCFPIIHMQTDYRDLEREIPVLTRILSAHRISCLLVDSYYVTQIYFSSLNPLCKTAYLDDLQAADYPVRLVVNYDRDADAGFYKNAGRVLCGSAYVPLREQFSCCSYHVWEQVKDVFLSAGGTDPFNISGNLLRLMLPSPDWKDCRFHVLTGPLHEHRPELNGLAEQTERVILHENVTEMASLMAECDLGFSAAGTTLHELCAVGVPSVSYSMADNQIPGAKAFDSAGLIPWVGDVRNDPAFYERACKALLELAQDPMRRREQSLRMRLEIDGAGADRIAAALTESV